uniref:Uncharacterized protein n=1 Tax=Caudovirales sp. ct2KA10 TaxID=2825757 RepID=A0A8S5U4N5_9CAUD|nr:MAG TPA: hypothetical protein [Caudovirales sp. ct2KA10]
MINLSGGIGRAIKKVVSAPLKVVGKVLGVGGAQSVNVSAPDVSGAQVVPSTASPAPEAPVLGTENTAQDKVKKKKGKSRLLINSDNSPSSGSSSYSGLNI